MDSGQASFRCGSIPGSPASCQPVVVSVSCCCHPGSEALLITNGPFYLPQNMQDKLASQVSAETYCIWIVHRRAEMWVGVGAEGNHHGSGTGDRVILRNVCLKVNSHLLISLLFFFHESMVVKHPGMEDGTESNLFR